MWYWHFIDFPHSTSVFANFSDGIAVLGTPQCPRQYVKLWYFYHQRFTWVPQVWATRGGWGMLSQKILKSWCSEMPFLVFWGDKFCLKCLLNRLLFLCFFSFLWLRVQVLEFIWSTSLSWHVHSYPGLLSLGTLVCLCLTPEKCHF